MTKLVATSAVRLNPRPHTPASKAAVATDHAECGTYRQRIHNKPGNQFQTQVRTSFGTAQFLPCVCVVSRFHVVSLQDRLDRQVAHAWVFGKVAFGPELVLQHLGKVSDVLA